MKESEVLDLAKTFRSPHKKQNSDVVECEKEDIFRKVLDQEH